MENFERKKTLAFHSLYFVAGFAVALALLAVTTEVGYRPCSRKMSNVYKHVSSKVPCDFEDKISLQYDADLKAKVQDYIDEAKVRNVTRHVSVYQYDLIDGTWFGINEYEKFYPSSLLKIPIVMAIMEEVEKNADFIFKQVRYDGIDTGLTQNYKPKEELVVGKTYSIGELAEISIKYSNNEAAFLLTQIIGAQKLSKVYEDIGLPLPHKVGEDFITIKQYVTLLKVLFNGSYLSLHSSEMVLDILTQSAFTDGLVAGVPASVEVAHKFGERIDKDVKGVQLHDCGIIYVPGRPYILCVMTRGGDFKHLSEIIKNISKIVYDNVSKRGEI